MWYCEFAQASVRAIRSIFQRNITKETFLYHDPIPFSKAQGRRTFILSITIAKHQLFKLRCNKRMNPNFTVQPPSTTHLSLISKIKKVLTQILFVQEEDVFNDYWKHVPPLILPSQISEEEL
jgi:hypothetical protein